MGSSLFPIACQHSVDGMDFLERGFSHSNVADTDFRASGMVGGRIFGSGRGQFGWRYPVGNLSTCAWDLASPMGRPSDEFRGTVL
jgi:hypothetical protein